MRILLFVVLLLAHISLRSTGISLDITNTDTFNVSGHIITAISEQEFYDYASIPESGGQYNIANNYLMVGKYQASFIALKGFGYSDKKIKNIRKSVYIKKNSRGKKMYYFDESLFPKEEQERFIRWYMYQMEHIYLKKYITEYQGKTINGVYITKAGILGSSILGHIYVKRFLRGDNTFKDAYGTSIYKRMKYFETVELETQI